MVLREQEVAAAAAQFVSAALDLTFLFSVEQHHGPQQEKSYDHNNNDPQPGVALTCMGETGPMHSVHSQ